MGMKVNTRGLQDWTIQRITALLLLVYFIYVLFFLSVNPISNYTTWNQLFASTVMKWSTLVAMLAICWHAWVGLWTIFTDYVKCSFIRRLLEIGVCVLMAP